MIKKLPKRPAPLKCRFWAEASNPVRRRDDAELYGHERHVCTEYELDSGEHDYKHLCACGFRWPLNLESDGKQ